MAKVEIEIPDGYVVDTANSTTTNIKLKKDEKELPETWKEFCKLHPMSKGEAYITETSDIYTCPESMDRCSQSDKNMLPTEEDAEGICALMQLIQLRDCYNDGWKPDWESEDSKYTIVCFYDKITKTDNPHTGRVLAFKTEELRDKFLYNFRNLITRAKQFI